MIINHEVIQQKNVALKKFFARKPQDIVADLSRLFGDVHDARMLEREWLPGGGSALFTASINGEDVFIKIKDKTLAIENRLECDPAFPVIGSLNNEASFCKLLSGDDRVPKLKAYVEDDTYAYAVFERLTPFDQGIQQLDAYERYQVFCEIEDFLRRLYDKGIIHSDVHEKNILFRGKQPVLIDFEEARLLSQDVSFAQSLDVVGENKYGRLGDFPEGYGLPGLTCLNRLRAVFKPLIKQVLPAFLEKCHFSNDCAFNVDDLQDKDERIYQSIDLGDSKYAGQRPLQDARHGILERLFGVLGPYLGDNLHVVDIGSNLGALSFAAAHCSSVGKVTGLEAFPEFAKVSQILRFFQREDKVNFFVSQAGVDPLPDEPIDVLFLFSVYHHVRNKDAFLQELVRHRPRAIITEFAVQERYYPQRGTAKDELRHIGATLGYKTLQIIGTTSDYGRPICLFSDLEPFPQAVLDSIMGVGLEKAPVAVTKPKVKLSYPVKVSIVLPTYNHAKYLPQALQSIFNQTFDDFELIVVDDGSTDQTAAILAGIKHPKLRVITQSNQKLPSALNVGFADARGEYWTWTSADNIMAPTWLEELVKALEDSPPEVGYALSPYANINEKGQIYCVTNDQCFETHSMLLHNGNASFLYRSEIAREAGLYDASLNGAEDLDMWLRISLLTRAIHVESVLYYYRLHENTMTKLIPAKIAVATSQMIEKFIASCGGKLDVDRIFPGIAKSSNPTLARWQAKVWLAGRLAGSAFCPVSAVANLFITAMAEKYESALAGNVVHVCALKDEWKLAEDVIAVVLKTDQSEFIRGLADIVARKDKESLKKIPFVSLNDSALIFDHRTQLSRAKLAG